MHDHDGGLSDRKKQILKAIVDMHIVNGEPVGSKYLMQNAKIQFSSATIRNEMAELESLGYLEQPHASSGRVPSKMGYQFYVDALMQRYRVTESEIQRLNLMLDAKRAELGGILDMASRLVGSMTNYTSLAAKPRNQGISIIRFDTVYISENHFVLVTLTSLGDVRSKNVFTAFCVTEGVLMQLVNLLNEQICGLRLEQITLPRIMQLKKYMSGHPELIDLVMKHIYELYEEFDVGDLHFDGVNRVLQYPEFSSAERLREIFDVFENKEDILSIVASADPNRTNVLIGMEKDKHSTQNNSALVFRPITRGGNIIGAIGVVGPCRMNYSKVTALIDCMADSISRIINENQEGLFLPRSDSEEGGQ